MPETSEVTEEPCERPSSDELDTLKVPFRPFPEGRGWFVHYHYRSDGTPAYRRLTHGDHAELWYRTLPKS